MSRPYVLPNRKAFSDSVTRAFIRANYREKDKDPLDTEDKDIDLCIQRTGNSRELFPYQKLVRDYLLIETPYRGLLLYHGLGSGKTCSSIAVAESLLTTQKVFVMLPASLETNYRGEIRKCGDPVYAYDQHWVRRDLTDETREEAKKLGISEKFLGKYGRFYSTVPGETPNFESLDKQSATIIRAQIEDLLGSRFTFIRYNGLSSTSIDKYTEPGMYDDSVVIIDEAHNLISRVINESDITRKLYDAIYNAKRCKIVALSGTPIINLPNEISYLMNLLRGPIERITIPFKTIPTWDEEKITKALRAVPEVDTIEFNALKKYVMVTRNPPNFRSTYNGEGERIAVQYMKDLAFLPNASDWVKSIQNEFETAIGGGEVALDRVTTEVFECLPTDYDEFAGLFLDGLKVKNPLMFQRRIQGLVSYFKGADERLLPKRIEDDKTLEKVEMSTEQFTRYLEVRWQEMKMDSRRGRSSLKDDMGSYRVGSRLACNYVIPPDLRIGDGTEEDEDKVSSKADVLKKLESNPARFLSEKALESFSPKLLKMVRNVKESLGKNQLVYSQYRELEGLGIFAAVLKANGWQPYKLVKQAGQWVEDPEMKDDKPAYAFYTGEEDADARELSRQIFNGRFADTFPATLKESVEKRDKKLLSLLMISSAGAEGITLENVRHVHIMEPHWNPARHDQVVGRAIRICSHARLPMDERTVKVSFYVSVFTEDQMRSAEYPNVVAIRRNDMVTKRYEGDPSEVFMSTDEYLYETAYEKERISQRIGLLLKQSAVDCEIHRKLHAREKPLVSCMRFDTSATGEDLAFKPNIKTEEPDETYLRNTKKQHRKLNKVLIKNMVLLIDPVSNEVFDGPAFDDNQRLLRLGKFIPPHTIRFILG